MKPSSLKLLTLIATIAIPFGMWSQSLNIRLTGGATYNFKGADTNNIRFDNRIYDGVTKHYITIEENEFDLSEVETIYTDPSVLTANNVSIRYTESAPEVIVSGDLAKYVEAEIVGGDVKIKQSTEVSDSVCGEITYTLSGSCNNGSFKLSGDYKSTIVLNSLSLISLNNAPINIDNGKRIALKIAEGTTNSISDAPGGSHKGAITCKGHLEFKQKGALQVAGKTAHAIYCKEYIQLKNSVITISEAAKDGVNCAQYLLMESGTLNILSSGDDGIQVSYKDTENREAEDTGCITIKNGTLNIHTSADAAKCLKAENSITIAGGKLTLDVSGNGLWDATKNKTKASACLSADCDLTIDGGELSLSATGSGGKGISCDGLFTMNDGSLGITTSGGMLVYSNGTLNHKYTGSTDRIASDYKSSPKGVKADGVVTINGGKIDIYTSGNGAEGIESKSTLSINGGEINIKAYDDGINSASDMTITGGNVAVVSTAGDGLDSNANISISGGTVRSFGGGGAEQGLDASTETGCTVKFTGGTILAAGGGNSAATSTASTQPFVTVSNATLKAGTEVAIKSGDVVLATLTVPAYYGTTSTPLGAPAKTNILRGPGGGGLGGFGSSGTVLSAPGMVSGQSYTITIGTTTTTATARLK